MGRTESHWRLASQAVMLASSSALVTPKNTLASTSRVCLSRRLSHWANTPQCPGGVSLPGPSSQYWAMTFWASVKLALYFSCSSTSWMYLPLGWPPSTLTAGPWLGRRGEPEGGHGAPVRGQEPLHRPVGQPQRLPAVGIIEGVGGVDRLIAGRHAAVDIVAGLVGAVGVAVAEHRLGGAGPHHGRGRGVGAGGGVAEGGGHLLVEGCLLGREQVQQGGVGGVADCLLFVGLGPLGGGLAQGGRGA